MDDVLGLTVLAVVTGVIAAANEGTKLSATDVGIILAKCTAFLVGSIVLGVLFSKRIFFFASKLRAPGVLLAAGLSFCFFMSWLAGFIGLAPIVGAFSAGLILEEIHSEKFVERGEPPLDTLLRPISSFLVPIFFVVIGMRTDLKSFLQEGIWGLAAALTIAAIIGKLICAAGVLGKNVDRLTIGIGMIPRGEVGLIFAGIGTSLTIAGRPILSDAIFSAIVVMVIVTTVMTPPSLKWSTGRRRQSGPSNAGAE